MKTIIMMCSITLFTSHAFAQVVSTTFSYQSSPKEIIKEEGVTKEEVYSYNISKNQVKDSTLLKTLYYDDLGFLIKESIPKIKKYAAYNVTYYNTYDATGRLLKQIENNEALKEVTTLQFQYDSLGNEITNYVFNTDTTLLTVERKFYNQENQCIQLATKINNGNYYIARNYSYFADGEMAKMEALNTKGLVTYSYIYEFDKSKNSKTVFLDNADGRKIVEEYFYNEARQCTKENSIQDGVFKKAIGLNKTTVNAYNSDGTIFESIIFIDGKQVQVNRHFYFK